MRKFILLSATLVVSIGLGVNAQTQTSPTDQTGQTGQVKPCPTITCIWDPCPGKHLPDTNGCLNCASPCSDKIKTSPEAPVCIQVITPAISPEGICKNFPTPCDVPANWKKVEKCPGEITPPTKKETISPIKQPSLPAEGQIKPVSPQTPGAETKAVSVSVPINVCAVSNEYLREINELIKQADLTKSRGDLEAEKNITEKIRMIKEKIEAKKKECQNTSQAQLQVPQATQTRTEDFCQLEKQIATKIEYYKELLSLSPQELKDKGYEREEVGKILGELQNERAKIHLACSGQKVGWAISEIKPVAPQKAEEVENYYKEKMAEVMTKAVPTETQIQEIKQIKEEAGTMVKELIRTQKEISVKEIQPIVEKMVVKPGMIETSQDQIKIPEQKKVKAMIGNKSAEILVEPQKLILKEGGVEVETHLPLNLTAQGSIIGDPGVQGSKEVKVAPSQILEKAAIKNPIDLKVELIQEKNKPVYKVKAVEKRKLFFFIPVNVSKNITIDASSEAATKLEENKPWWSFLAF